MKKLGMLLLVLQFCFGLIGCSQPKPNQSVVDYQPFSVMSFNIRIFGLEDRDDKYWDYRKEDVIALIKRHDCDIIGFQEVKDPQFEYLVAQLPDYEYYGINSWAGSNFAKMMGSANAVFYKKNRFEALHQQTLWQSDTPQEQLSHWEDVDIRTITMLRLKDKLSGEEFSFINTHLSVKKLGQTKATAMLLEIADQTNEGVIITGDFNYQQDTEDYLIMTSASLSDAMVLAPDSDSGGTFHGFNGTTHKPWPKPIDFIFLTNAYFAPTTFNIIRDSNSNGHYPSDHYPVKTIVEYKKR